LQGLAGAGKTTTLEAIREAAQHNGYARRGLRPDHARRSPPTPGGGVGDGLQRRRRELAGPRLKHISHRREKIMSDIEHRYYRSFAQM
jgi:hypothetical protein